MAETKTAGETATAEAEAKVAATEPETAAAPEAETGAGGNPKRIPKGGIVKPEDLGHIADAFLAYTFPDDAKQTQTDSKFGQKNAKTGKLEVTGYRSQYIINALNEIIGPGNWREYGTDEVEKPATAYVTVYRGTFEIGNWKERTTKRTRTWPDGTQEIFEGTEPYFEVLAQFHQTGGSRNMDKWESIKGARTNFLKKVCSYISNGWRAYALVMDEDFESLPPEVDKPTPSARPTPPATAGKEPEAPATANAKLITSEQQNVIKLCYQRLGYKPEQIPERITNLEQRMGKPFAEFTEGEARDTIKKMEKQIEENAAKKEQEEEPAE